jgi:hypothetical protein
LRHAKRTDANHAHIRDGLRALGWDICDLSDVGGGVPDLVARMPDHGLPVFFEVKVLEGKRNPKPKKLTPAEETWMKYCGHITYVVTSLEEAISILTNTLDTQKIPTGATS